jgi:hypothetical protein
MMPSVVPTSRRGECVPLERVPPRAAQPGAAWFIAVTAPRMERIAQDQCSRLGVPTFLPLKELPPGDIRACAPLWPGYLFVAAPYVPPTVTAARSMVATSDGPVVTPRGMVERLMERADKDGIVLPFKPPPAAPRFAVGETVRINSGPMTGAFGTIARINGHHARVALNLFASIVPVDVRTEQIARVA